MVPESHFLILGAILFSLGLFGALTRRNAVGILMSIELILNAANINFIAFNKFLGKPPDGLGDIFALMVIAVAASSAVVGLALIIAIYRNAKTIFADQINLMKW